MPLEHNLETRTTNILWYHRWGVEAMQNALIVGGTGMLSGLAKRFLDDYYQVFVIGRDPAKFVAMEQQAGDRVEYLTCMALDYHELARLGDWVAHLQLMHGPLDKVVAWVHGDAKPVLDVVAREVEQYRQSSWDLYHVLPIAASIEDPSISIDMAFGRYRKIVLGYVEEDKKTRWLTHREIVDGVYDALNQSDDSIVGCVHPYSHRPQ